MAISITFQNEWNDKKTIELPTEFVQLLADAGIPELSGEAAEFIRLTEGSDEFED